MKYDFIAIGDVVTDAFVRLFDESAKIVDSENPQLCLGYGAKIPFERSYVIPGVGNSANAVVAASRLGLSSSLISNIGNDYHGTEILKTLKKENVDTSFVTVNEGKISNYHYVLWYKDDRTILIRHEAFEYILPVLDEPRWIYFSSVGEGHVEFHNELADYVRKNKNTKLVFQPGTFQIQLGTQALKNLYRATEFFVCNREEAQLILKSANKEILPLMKGIHDLGPRIIAITDGKKGAYASDGSSVWFLDNYPDPKPPYERTGAGDAFSSTFAAALALGLSVPEALRWGPINSMSVVQYVGAQEGLLRRDQLEKYLAEAPADYKPKVFATL